MSYILTWKNPAAVSPAKANITVPVGSTVTTGSSLTFTGKGAANYGKIQQENLLRLLENFADSVAPPSPTVGQTWFDTATSTLKVLADASPVTWKALGGLQILDSVSGPPASPQVGDLWFERTGPLSGYLYVYNGIGRFPYSLTSNGGWSQIWPRVDAAGLRQEYDQVEDLIEALTTNLTYLTGRLFTQLPSFTSLDVDLAAKLSTAGGDLEVNNTGGAIGLSAQPVSYDWDALLSMGRWVISRLDLPSTAWQDVSGYPFVQDGRQARTYLSSTFAADDPRYSEANRRASRPLGTITLHRLYAETINLLSAAAPFKYSLRGISGSSGTNTTFAPDVVTYLHCRRQGSWTGSSPAVSVTAFNWSTTEARDRFIAGGNAIELTLRLIGGAGANDTSLNSFFNQYCRIRITGDMVRWMDSATTPALSTAPGTVGLADVTATASVVSLGSVSDGTRSVVLSGQRTTAGFTITATITSPAGLTGQTQVTCGIIRDCTTYDPTEIDLYPAPLGYNSGTDSVGTDASLANVVLVAPPSANFTANGNTGPTQFNVTLGASTSFVFTGAGSPTLIEWDFEGDGTFTATGSSVNFTYPARGYYSPRVRVTNAGGSDVLTRHAMIRVV